MTTDDGFEIVVRPLLAKEHAFGNAKLPANVNQITLKASEMKGAVDVDIVETDDHIYDKIEILGRRMVICCTLRGSLADGPDLGALVSKWDTATLQAGYDVPLQNKPNASARERDEERKADRFSPVYRLFGAKTQWNFNSGTAAPSIDVDGNVIAGEITRTQETVRATLSWLPLKEGFDYRDGQELDRTASGVEPDLMPPVVWLKDPATSKYFPVHTRDMTVSVPKDMLGIFVDASPIPHRIGKNHIGFDDLEKSFTLAEYDYDTMVATIAFEADQRGGITITRQEDGVDVDTPSGGTITIPTNAELWYLAPNTVVDVDDGKLVLSGGLGRILRDDLGTLDLAVAGAISRYWESRKRATITFEGLLPMAGILGHILKLDDDAGDTGTLQSPITSIEWIWPETESTGGAPGDAAGLVTIVRTGFAL